MKKILIITYSFPPLNNIASRRFGELVPYLKELGWEIDVLTTNSNGTLPVGISEENIIRFQNHPQQDVSVDKNVPQSIIIKYLLKIKRLLGFNLRLYDRTYFKWYKEVIKQDILKDKKYSLILSSYGPSASLYLGNYLSRKWETPWIADFRDLGALYKDKSYRSNFIMKIIDRKIERRLLKNVTAITSVSNVLVDILKKTYQKPAYSILNGWTELKVHDSHSISKEKYIYYAGRLYPHQMPSLFKLIDVLEDIPGIKLIIRSLGPHELNEKIDILIKEKELSQKIKVLSPADQQTVLIEATNSFVNLVLEDLDREIEWKKGTLTGKLLGLLPLAPPILTIAREDSEIGDILKLTNKGAICSTREGIYKYLSKIDASMYKGNENINLFSKKNQAEKLNSIMSKYI